MKAAAKLLEFEHAAYLRDKIKELEAAAPAGEKTPAAQALRDMRN